VAVSLSLQAARRDEHAYAYEEAVAHYRRALEAARALGFGLIDVHRLERILVLALEQEGLPIPPAAERFLPVSHRFARPGAAFDHHAPQPEGQP